MIADTKYAAKVATDYKMAVAKISAKFMDDHPELPPQVMTIALMEVTMGLYRQMTGASRDRFMTGNEVMWDTMNELEGYHE